MVSSPSCRVIFFWIPLFLIFSIEITTVHGAPPGCEEVLQNMTDCTLPTIVKCKDEPPICTAEHTIEFERKCLKCKNKKPKRKDKGKDGSRVNNEKKKVVMIPMGAAQILQEQVMTRGRAKAICHQARQEVAVEGCLEDIVKCGNQPAICGRHLLQSCDENELLMICESFGYLKPKSGAMQQQPAAASSMVWAIIATTTTMLLLVDWQLIKE